MVSRRNGLRDKWRAAVLVNPAIDGETRAMLLVLHSWMTDNGRVSVPRQRLADMFGVDPRRITERIKRARDARLLDKVGGGYRGRTSIYDAVIPAGKVAVIPPPFSPNGGGLDTPKIRHLSTGTNRAERTGKVAVGTVPNARAYLSESRKRDDHKRGASDERNHAVPKERSDGKNNPASPPRKR